MPRRRADVLMPLEEDILRIGIDRAGSAEPEFHAFALAQDLGDGGIGGKLLGHGTLYKALSRLEHQGLLESRWEEIDPAEAGRPRRRLYRVTGGAAAALAASATARELGSTRPATA